MVQKFPNVFPKELQGLAPERKIEFSIELALNITLISKTPYRVALVELQELKSSSMNYLRIGSLDQVTFLRELPFNSLKRKNVYKNVH